MTVWVPGCIVWNSKHLFPAVTQQSAQCLSLQQCSSSTAGIPKHLHSYARLIANSWPHMAMASDMQRDQVILCARVGRPHEILHGTLEPATVAWDGPEIYLEPTLLSAAEP